MYGDEDARRAEAPAGRATRRRRAALAADARGYTELIREHIRIEDEYFYKLADQVLTEAEHAAIVEQFSGSPGNRAAHPERERYLKMLDVVSGRRRGLARVGPDASARRQACVPFAARALLRRDVETRRRSCRSFRSARPASAGPRRSARSRRARTAIGIEVVHG